MTNTKVKYFCTILSFILLVGCSSMGGGTIGTGLSYGGKSGAKRGSLRYTLHGKVLGSEGQALSGVDVTVKTPTNAFKTKTRRDGTFEVFVETFPGESIDFSFSSRFGKGDCSSNISPAGEENVFVDFKIQKSGKLKCP